MHELSLNARYSSQSSRSRLAGDGVFEDAKSFAGKPRSYSYAVFSNHLIGHSRRNFLSELVGRRQTDHIAGSFHLAIQGRATQAIYVLGIDRSILHKLV